MLSRAGKRVLVLLLVLGVLDWAAAVTLDVSQASSVAALASLSQAHSALSVSLQSAEAQARSCAGAISCVEVADGQLGAAFETFDVAVQAIAFPSSARSAASTLEGDANRLVVLLRRLSSDGAGAYTADASQLGGLANQFDTDYQSLGLSLV